MHVIQPSLTISGNLTTIGGRTTISGSSTTISGRTTISGSLTTISGRTTNQQIVTAFEHALNKLFVKITRSTLLLSMAF